MHALIVRRHAAARTAAVTAVAAAALALTPVLAQAAPPAVSTGSANMITPTTANLRGAVNPKGKATVYFFQYGRTKAYGLQTGEVPAGAGAKGVAAAASVLALTPSATYHFRLVARNPDGTVVGADKAFATKKQPLGFTLEAAPNPVVYGGAVTLQGVLSGTGNAGRPVALQQKPYPYTGGFVTVGNPQVTGATGTFAFPLLGVPINTQFRVVTTDSTKVTSTVVILGVALDVETKTSSKTVKRGHSINFSGKIHPAKLGALYAIQRLSDTKQWVTVAGGVIRKGGTTYSSYEKRVTIKHGGDYRVFVGVPDGQQVPGIGRTIHIKTH